MRPRISRCQAKQGLKHHSLVYGLCSKGSGDPQRVLNKHWPMHSSHRSSLVCARLCLITYININSFNLQHHPIKEVLFLFLFYRQGN